MPRRRPVVRGTVPAPGGPAAPPEADAARGGLRRELNLFGAVSMIVGIVIGSAIFLGVNRVAAGAGSPWLMVVAWLLGGGMTLMGALTYAELGAMFPRAGGEYVFLRKGLGSFWAFMSGWTAFTVNLAGSAAALAAIFATQLFRLIPTCAPTQLFAIGGLEVTTQTAFAAALVLLFSSLNWFGLRLGGTVQKALTLVKGGLMVALAAAALLYTGPAGGSGSASCPKEVAPLSDGFTLAGFFGLAMVQVLFAYDGWTNVTRVGSEIKDPSRNLPRAMFLGVGAVVLLYTLLSLGYVNVLGFEGFAGSPKTVASDTANQVLGPLGERFVAVLILLSVAGSLNGITIAGPRIYYAMAKDRLFPRAFGDVNRHHVPGRAIWAQALLAVLFLPLGFDALSDNVVFISFLFYALAAIGLFVLRRRMPDAPRPYKVPGYPWLPLLFVLASLTFVGYLLWQAITEPANVYRILGLAVVAAGIPVYLVYRKRAMGADGGAQSGPR